jgi:hypothetical protein
MATWYEPVAKEGPRGRLQAAPLMKSEVFQALQQISPIDNKIDFI